MLLSINSLIARMKSKCKPSAHRRRRGVETPNSGKREEDKAPAEPQPSGTMKSEIYGEEMIEKKVSPSGSIRVERISYGSRGYDRGPRGLHARR